MRIVAVADTHTFERDLVVPEGDVFVHAGDLLRAGSLDELAHVGKWIRSLPHAHKMVVAGNHDECFETHRAEACELLGDAHYLQDSEVTVGGLRFWGSPWQPTFRDWAFNLDRGLALRAKWALIPAGIDVLVTHGPPFGIGDRGPDGDRFGCEDLAARVIAIAPLLHLFGHVHQDGGVWQQGATCFANVTTWECERQPTVIEMDCVPKRVVSVRVPPAR